MRRAIWTLAAVALLSAACSEATTSGGAGAGTLVVRLTTPHADDGAVLFAVSGAPIDSMTVNGVALRLFTRRGGDSIVAAVVGPLANGAIVRLHVPDVTATGYTATVIDVADREDALRATLAGYALSVTR